MSEVKQDSRVSTVRSLMTTNKSQIGMALPKHMNVDRMLRMAMTTFQTNPKLLDCSPVTLFGAVIKCAEMGLEPGNLLNNVHLVPFGRKVEVIIGYKGLIQLARRSGEFKGVMARIIYEKEPFDLNYGFETKFSHIPKPPSERGTKIIGAYAVVHIKESEPVFDFMWLEEIEKIRNKSKAYKYDPKKSIWTEHFEEMCKKTVIRRAMKYVPMSSELSTVVAKDEAVDIGKSLDIVLGDDEVIDITAEEEEDIKKKTQKRIESTKAKKTTLEQVDKSAKKKIDKDKETPSASKEYVTLTDFPGMNHAQSQLWGAILELNGGHAEESRNHLSRLTWKEDIYSVSEGKAQAVWEDSVKDLLEKHIKENNLS